MSLLFKTIVSFWLQTHKFENKIIESKEKLFSVGLGFGILTKAGLFRLIYANGKSEKQNFTLNNSKGCDDKDLIFWSVDNLKHFKTDAFLNPTFS